MTAASSFMVRTSLSNRCCTVSLPPKGGSYKRQRTFGKQEATAVKSREPEADSWKQISESRDGAGFHIRSRRCPDIPVRRRARHGAAGAAIEHGATS